MAQMYNQPMYGYNPYQQQPQYQPQYQQYIQQSSAMPNVQNTLPGRVVEDISLVGANDVPMDGSKAVFLKSDGTVLYVKQWQPNGTISTVAYKPYIEPKEVQAEQVTTDELKSVYAPLKEQLDNIENMLNKMFGSKKTTTKKEGVEE